MNLKNILLATMIAAPVYLSSCSSGIDLSLNDYVTPAPGMYKPSPEYLALVKEYCPEEYMVSVPKPKKVEKVLGSFDKNKELYESLTEKIYDNTGLHPLEFINLGVNRLPTSPTDTFEIYVSSTNVKVFKNTLEGLIGDTSDFKLIYEEFVRFTLDEIEKNKETHVFNYQ